MKRGVLTLLSVTGSLAFAAGAMAITTENPYQPIVDRNIFALRPPPPPPSAEELAAKQPPPNIFLTGITTIFGNKRVLLKTTPTAGPAKPGAEKPTEESYVLTEGQRDGDVEVIQIDEKAGTVKIRLAGKEMTLDFDNNGVKAVASAPAPGQPGAPGMPPTGLIRPAGFNAPPRPTSVPGTTTSMPGIPGRPMRSSGAVTPTTSAGYGYNPGGGISFGGYRSGGTANNANPSNASEREARAAAAAMSPEERLIMIEAHRQRAEKAGSPAAALFPPTVLSPGPAAPGQSSGDGTQVRSPFVMPPAPGAPGAPR